MGDAFSADRGRHLSGGGLSSAAFDLYAEHVSPGKVAFFRAGGLEFVLGRREGPFMWDLEGKRRLINCHCNGGVFNFGHRHPALVAALERALLEYDIGNHHLPSLPRARLAERLAACAPGPLDYTVFAAGGGEAVDCAIKVARKATGRRGIVSASGGYHGHTGLALAAGEPKFSAPFLSEDAHFRRVPFNDLPALDAAFTNEVAAVVLETVPATLGMPIPDAAYLPGVKALCEARGAVYIADEVQTGLGRTGKCWGVEHFGVAPDILVTGKGLSGGLYPIAATLLTAEMESVFHDDPFSHISTFGGAELGCPVAEKVLELVHAEGFLDHVNGVSARLYEGLETLRARHAGLVAEIRRLGMMMGIRMAGAGMGRLLAKACFDAGLFCVYAAHDTSVLQFLPPLIVDADLAGEIVQRMDRALEIAAQWAG